MAKRQSNLSATPLDKVSVYMRLFERVGFPTVICGLLLYALVMFYNDVKEIALQQIHQTTELVAVQKEILAQIKDFRVEAKSAHNNVATK